MFIKDEGVRTMQTGSFLTLIKKLKDKKMIIFGTGKASEFLTEYMPIQPMYYVDNDAKKWGESFKDHLIYNPSVLLNEKKADIIILVASSFFQEIAQQLTKMGFQQNIHFWSGMDVQHDISDIMLSISSIRQNNEGNSQYDSQISQKNLLLHYQNLKNQKLPLPNFEDTGFRVYSQNEEDGLLLYIFSLIGTTNKVCFDLACGIPKGSNSANLICNLGWSGLLIDGDDDKVQITKAFYESNRDTINCPPQVMSKFITTENINNVLLENGVSGEIDLFSLDMDGIDYWIWESVDVINPRVVMVEYQYRLGEEDALTVPYKTDFNRFDICPNYYGASLQAFIKLANKKGYRLVGCNRYGYNAFFVRNDIGEDVLPRVTSFEKCFYKPFLAKYKDQVLEIRKYDWAKV